MQIFDTHAHYNDRQFDADRAELLSSLQGQGVGTIVNVGASFQDCKDSLALAGKYPFVYAAVGLHPDNVGELEAAQGFAGEAEKEKGEAAFAAAFAQGAGRKYDLAGLKELAAGNPVFDWLLQAACTEEKVIAIGEIGLDYHWDVEDRQVQKKWFCRQLDLARACGLPVSIHSRDAAEDTLAILREYAKDLCKDGTGQDHAGDLHKGESGQDHAGSGFRAVLHCYSYSPELAEEYIRLGYYIGVGGVVTFKNGKKLKRSVEAVPLDRILLETDCPYLAPDPFRGKRNQSSYIHYVADEIGRLKGISKEEVIRVTEHNAKRFFGLTKKTGT